MPESASGMLFRYNSLAVMCAGTFHYAVLLFLLLFLLRNREMYNIFP